MGTFAPLRLLSESVMQAPENHTNLTETKYNATMKKLLSLMVSVTCALSAISCGGFTPEAGIPVFSREAADAGVAATSSPQPYGDFPEPRAGLSQSPCTARSIADAPAARGVSAHWPAGGPWFWRPGSKAAGPAGAYPPGPMGYPRGADRMCRVGQNSYRCSVVTWPLKAENSSSKMGTARNMASGASMSMVV